MRITTIALMMSLTAGAVHAAEFPTWDAYIKKNRYKCPGPFDTLTESRTVELAGKSYEHTGYKMVVKNPDADDKVVIGVVSAIKDVTPGTKKNLADAFAWFKKKGVEWIVANGDLALDEFDLEEVLDTLAGSGLPVLIVLGNSESKGSFARAYKERYEKHPNLVNGVLIRQIVADDIEVWTIPGYYDKRFAHQGATCRYQEDDVEETEDNLTASGDRPIALVSHGPPAGKGRNALDWISSKSNVGDEAMAKLIVKKNIAVGLFGHILEAGGSAVGKDFSKPIRPGKEVPNLYVNAGSASGDPWAMNDGKTSYGMAMVVTVQGGKASYQIKRYPNRIED
jgi:Icc-related predicted phosphoesterase